MRASVGAALVCFVALNVALLPLKSYFEKQHRTNLMQADHSRSNANEVPRYDWSTGSEQQKYWSYIPDARKQRLVIVDGMSQQYAINDEQPGDRVISEILDDSLKSAGARVFGIAAPNLNHVELLLHLQALVQDSATTPELLVFGVCFDKMRGVEVRETMQQALIAKPALVARWQRTLDSLRSSAPELADQMSRTLAASRTQQVTRLDQRVEQTLVSRLATAIPIVSLRADLRTFLFAQVYLFRNWVFQIKTSTKRPVLADRYAVNQQALVTSVRFAKQHHIRVLLYVIPLNLSADAPYVTEQYDAFKQWLKSTAATEGVAFANLEAAVPNESWGLLYGQPDFKHFKEAGHLATAKALLPLIRTQLSDSTAR